MTENEKFTLSDTEARRMRRGAFLPIFLILPLAAMFGLDASKSQPMHFLMTFTVAAGIAAVIVSMGLHGAKRRIEEFSRTSLAVVDGNIVWTKGSHKHVLRLADVRNIDVLDSRGSVRSIILRREGGAHTTLEGYERMDDLLIRLRQHSAADVTRTSRWLGL